ncbi:MAG: DJ-1/PfpI family protein [Clostridia bacterium]|nr:DJ-1/PfpI family protein [Clostridia bacterium]
MIYMFLAEGFEETEAIAALDIMRRGGLDVRTVGVDKRSVTGSHGITVVADLVGNELSDETPEGVILPGGMPGTINLEASEIVTSLLKKTYDNGGLVAAICAAPSVLGHLGMLDGKKAVCYPGFESELHGAEPGDGKTATDGNVITACGAGAAIEFGLEVVRYFAGFDEAERIRKSILL